MGDRNTKIKSGLNNTIDEHREKEGNNDTPKLLFSDFLLRFNSQDSEIKTSASVSSREGIAVDEKTVSPEIEKKE